MAKVDLTTILSAKNPTIPEEPVIVGKEAEVDLLIAKKRETDRAAAEFSKVRRGLECEATNLRITMEERGAYHTTVKLQGSNDTLTMSYNDQLKGLSVDDAPAVEKSIGSKAFGKLWEKTKSYAFTGDQKQANKLRKILREAGENPDEYFEVKECFAPAEDFRKTRFELRPKLSDTQNAALDLVISRLQYEPRLGGVKWAEGETKPNGNGKKGA